MSDETPSQTVGPFLSIGLTWPDGNIVVPDGIRISGVLTDGTGDPVSDGLVETWQADPDGHFDWPGFGRCPTDPEGRFTIVTLKPGAIGDGQAPHIDVSVFARGLLNRVVTRIYFPDEAAANATDPLFSSLPPDRARTLIAVPDGPGELRFDIRLQGEDETVFLAV